MMRSLVVPLLLAALVVALAAAAVPTWFAQSGRTQTPSPDNDWPSYRRDAAGTGYSPLADITPANVGGLAAAWTYNLENDVHEDEDAEDEVTVQELP